MPQTHQILLDLTGSCAQTIYLNNKTGLSDRSPVFDRDLITMHLLYFERISKLEYIIFFFFSEKPKHSNKHLVRIQHTPAQPQYKPNPQTNPKEFRKPFSEFFLQQQPTLIKQCPRFALPT